MTETELQTTSCMHRVSSWTTPIDHKWNHTEHKQSYLYNGPNKWQEIDKYHTKNMKIMLTVKMNITDGEWILNKVMQNATVNNSVFNWYTN